MRLHIKEILLFPLFILLMQLYTSEHLWSQKSSKHIEIATKYVGVTEETGNNDGEEIAKWLRFVGITTPASYCAAFVSYVLEEAGAVYPKIRTALAKKFITSESISAKKAIEGRLLF